MGLKFFTEQFLSKHLNKVILAIDLIKNLSGSKNLSGINDLNRHDNITGLNDLFGLKKMLSLYILSMESGTSAASMTSAASFHEKTLCFYQPMQQNYLSCSLKSKGHKSNAIILETCTRTYWNIGLLYYTLSWMTLYCQKTSVRLPHVKNMW